MRKTKTAAGLVTTACSAPAPATGVSATGRPPSRAQPVHPSRSEARVHPARPQAGPPSRAQPVHDL